MAQGSDVNRLQRLLEERKKGRIIYNNKRNGTEGEETAAQPCTLLDNRTYLDRAEEVGSTTVPGMTPDRTLRQCNDLREVEKCGM